MSKQFHMSKRLIEQLSTLNKQGRLNPDHVWVKNTRARLMHQIQNTVSKEDAHQPSAAKLVSWFLPESFKHTLRPAAMTFGFAVLTVGGWIAGVNASYNSLPGEVLYGVKIATEKTQVAFASITNDKEVETKLHLEFAARRSSEAKKVLESTTDQDASKKAQTAVKKIKESIESANKSAKEVDTGDITKAVSMAKDITQTTQEIKKDLKEVAKNATSEIELKKEVVEVASAVKQVELDTIEDVVNKVAEKKDQDALVEKSEGSVIGEQKSNEKPEQDVAKLVSQTITELTESAKEIKEEVQKEVKADVATLPVTKDSLSKETLKTVDQVVTTTEKIAGVSAGEVQKSASPQEVGKIIKDVVQKVGQTVNRTSEILQEAQDFVDGNNLLGAIHKAKEAHQVTKETAQAVVEVKDAVKKVQDDAKKVAEQQAVSIKAAQDSENAATGTVKIMVENNIANTENTSSVPAVESSSKNQ